MDKKNHNLTETLTGELTDNKSIYNDIVALLESSYLKILKINLTTKQHEDILVHAKDMHHRAGYADNIDDWLKGFAKSGGIHPEDVKDYMKFTDLKFIKNHFNNTKEDLIVRYRRSSSDGYHWVNMIFKRSIEYTPQKQLVMLYIQDVEKQINQDAKISAALFEAFNVYVSSLTEKQAMGALLEILCEFYSADCGRITLAEKHVGRKVMFSYVADDAIPIVFKFSPDRDWEEHFGTNNEYNLELYDPKENINTRVVLRAIMMLIHVLLNKRNEIEYQNNLENQLRIISGLSNIYFCVYLVNTKENEIKRIHSVDYLDNLFGELTDYEEIFNRVNIHLVTEEYRHVMTAFNNVKSWPKKLKDRNDISMEFVGLNQGWTRANVIVLQRDENGVPFEYFYTVREINDQKKREEKYNKSIKEALDYANKANQAKSTFLSNMSHDIRTPMNAIIGYTDLAAAHINETEKVKEYIENIATAGKHLMSLINDVLDMSRIESGRIEIREENIDIVEMLENIKMMNSSITEGKNITLTLDTAQIKHREILSDSLRVNQIFINLVGNAIKFTNSGGRVEVSAVETKTGKDNSIYRFSVKDNGIGIEESFIDKLFEPFERERTATESQIEGTGLGLAIVKNIIDLMGGTIKVKSKKGEGTEFIIEIPLKFVKFSHEAVQEAEKSTSDVDITKLKILLVEDNEINRMIARAIFADRHMYMEEAHNGQEAVDILLEKGVGYYDLVLMDVQMPVLNGYEATKKIRNFPDEGLSTIPIIAMTANAFEEDKTESLKAGMNAHVSKPINVEILIDTIKSVL